MKKLKANWMTKMCFPYWAI